MLLKELSEAIGVSGDEGAVRALIHNAIKDHVDDITIDGMGNLIAFKKGTGEQPLTAVVAAHMDEVGFMVTGHTGDGMLLVESIGGIDAKILPAMRVLVGKDKLYGVFMWKPIHLSNSQDIVPLDKMQIDIGASSKDAAAGAAPIGTRVAFDSRYIELSDTVVRGKAFDDRAGCSELVDLCQGDPLPFDMYAAFTVQEEVGLRGAKVVAASTNPDFAIILEATACHEVPQDPHKPDQTTVTKLGQGTVISYMDRTSIAHPGLLKHFQAVAKDAGLPYQFRSSQFAGGTDAGSIHISQAGIPSIGFSLPCRYLHSPHTIISLEDYKNTVALVRAGLERITPDVLER